MLFILPVSANTLVPFDFSVPKPAYQSAPLVIIAATLPKVSTLLIFVGFPQSPATAGNGGLGRGIPRLPSIDAINAVSSPQTNAPAPSLICSLKLNPEPKIFSPNNPIASACSIAMRRRLMASGYSART